MFTEDGLIEGINKNCSKYMHIQNDVMNSQQHSLNLFEILPQFKDELFYEKMRSQEGEIFSISKSNFRQLFDLQDLDFKQEHNIELYKIIFKYLLESSIGERYKLRIMESKE